MLTARTRTRTRTKGIKIQKRQRVASARNDWVAAAIPPYRELQIADPLRKAEPLS